jgi:pyoverdine/dityrosine biosynthesis protein Dit1
MNYKIRRQKQKLYLLYLGLFISFLHAAKIGVKGLRAELERIGNLDEFMQYFLMRETRMVNKYGRIKLKGNTYPVKSAMHGKVVNVRYDPFDLTKIFIYNNNGRLLETTEPSILKIRKI